MKLAALVGIIGQLGVYSNATVGGVNLDIICVLKAFQICGFFFEFRWTDTLFKAGFRREAKPYV